ncbi:MAG: hypothetical protein ACREQ4_06810, partial [Candidatus Binataceae bacterium]
MKRIALVVTAAILLLSCESFALAGQGAQLSRPSDYRRPPVILGTTLPSDFPVIINPYLGVPVIGFGAKGDWHNS